VHQSNQRIARATPVERQAQCESKHPPVELQRAVCKKEIRPTKRRTKSESVQCFQSWHSPTPRAPGFPYLLFALPLLGVLTRRFPGSQSKASHSRSIVSRPIAIGCSFHILWQVA